MPYLSYPRNAIYYKEFTSDNGRAWKLQFIPGDTIDLSSPYLIEFPDDVISEIEIENGFENEIPPSMELGATCKLKLNLSNLKDSGSQVYWAYVKSYITQGITPTTRSVNGHDIQIPNRWVITEYNGSSWIVIFHGIQDLRPEKEYNYETKLEYQIELIDIVRASYERTLIVDLEGVIPTSATNELRYLGWGAAETAGYNYLYGVGYKSRYYIKLAKVVDILSTLQTKAQLVYRALMRSASPQIIDTGNPYSRVWKTIGDYVKDSTGIFFDTVSVSDHIS